MPQGEASSQARAAPRLTCEVCSLSAGLAGSTPPSACRGRGSTSHAMIRDRSARPRSMPRSSNQTSRMCGKRAACSTLSKRRRHRSGVSTVQGPLAVRRAACSVTTPFTRRAPRFRPPGARSSDASRRSAGARMARASRSQTAIGLPRSSSCSPLTPARASTRLRAARRRRCSPVLLLAELVWKWLSTPGMPSDKIAAVYRRRLNTDTGQRMQMHQMIEIAPPLWRGRRNLAAR